MKAKAGYIKWKDRSPRIGRWLKRYWEKRTCRKWNVERDCQHHMKHINTSTTEVEKGTEGWEMDGKVVVGEYYCCLCGETIYCVEAQ